MIILYDIRVCKLMLKKEFSLDLGLIRDDSVLDYADLLDLAESAAEAATKLENEFSFVKVFYACKKQKYVLK